MMFLSDAGGVGLNLQRAASCCIHLELPWNPAVLEQRIGRIYRLGQSLPIDVYNLVSEEGIEGRIAGLIARKRAVFSGLFGVDPVLWTPRNARNCARSVPWHRGSAGFTRGRAAGVRC